MEVIKWTKNEWMKYYNSDRTHQGKMSKGSDIIQMQQNQVMLSMTYG